MKNILLFIAFISMFGLKAQTGFTAMGNDYQITTAQMTYFPNNLYIPPTIWYTIDVLTIGIDSCEHKWYHSEPHSYATSFGSGYMSCAVLHAPGTRCSWTIQTRKSICSKCFRHVVEQDEDLNPKPEVPIVPVETYESILERLNKKE